MRVALHSEQAEGVTAGPRRSLSLLAPTFGWYVLFGAGYVSYMTFIITLLRTQGMETWSFAAFFIVLGAASAAAGTLVEAQPSRSRAPLTPAQSDPVELEPRPAPGRRVPPMEH